MMNRIIFLFLLIYSSNLFAKNPELLSEMTTVPSMQLAYMFEEQTTVEIKDLVDLIDKDAKVTVCVENYIKKQSKSYSKIVQRNLYNLINDFDRIASGLSGKKPKVDEIPYEDKIEALAKVQCEAYYTMGVLK